MHKCTNKSKFLKRHDWGKWSDPRETVMGVKNETGWLSVCQYRICKDCGICEYRDLPHMRSIKGILKEAEREKK